MELEDKNIQNEEAQIRRLIQTTRMEAPENLNYRIMQQIETDKVFSAKPKVKKSKLENTIRDIVTIAGIMYIVLALIGIASFIMNGKDYLLSSPFLSTVLLVVFIFTLLWLITRLDEYLRKKQNGKANGTVK